MQIIDSIARDPHSWMLFQDDPWTVLKLYVPSLNTDFFSQLQLHPTRPFVGGWRAGRNDEVFRTLA